jgi:hypothetical protein
MNISPAVGNEIIQLAVCEMVVVWVQSQLRENRMKAQINAYLNQVNLKPIKAPFMLNIWVYLVLVPFRADVQCMASWFMIML